MTNFTFKPARVFVVMAFILCVCSGGSVMAQSLNVKGVVTDAAGDPLIGVSVIVEGTQRGVSTGVDGSYSITVPSSTAILKFNYLGYSEELITVGSQTTINVTLQEDTSTLDEIVVVGYGTMRKRDVTGALSHIGADDIQEQPVQNALQAMQGRMSGVDITTSNRPGTLGDIRIRGNRSLNASNEPLYVIDGIPMGSGVGTSPNTSLIGEHEFNLSAGSMADLNPADIESIDVLKDASATAIYGSRGANGVVLITTKKGREGRTTVNYDGTTTFTRVHSLTDWMSSGEMLDFYRSAYINGGNYGGRYGTAPDPMRDRYLMMGNVGYMNSILGTAYQLNNNDVENPVLRDATAAEKAMGYADRVPVYDSSQLFDNDWTKYVNRVARTDSHQISVSGGNNNTKFYASAAYLNQESTNRDQDYQRFTINSSGEVKATKWFTLGASTNVGYSIQDYGIMNNLKNGGAKDSYGQSLQLARWAPTFADADGNPVLMSGRSNIGTYDMFTPGRTNGPSGHNILNNLDKAFNENRATSVIASTYAEINIMEGLKFRTNFGAQYRQQRNGRYYAPGWSNPQNVTDSNEGWGYYGSTANLSWTLENLIYFDRTFGDHTVGATLLQSAEQFRSEMIWMRFQDLTYESAKWYKGSANINGKPQSYDTGLAKTTMASYMARLNYGFKNRYLITVTGRYDGSSVLAKSNKWDFFPSVSLAWKIEEENFMQNQNIFSQLKLRAGYGETGNSSVSAYSTGGLTVNQNYLFGSNEVNGSKAQMPSTPTLGWERTAQINIGLDFGVLRNRISGSIEFYNADTKDLLMLRKVPGLTGYDQVYTNMGATRNTGIEISLNSTNITNKDFTWTTSINFSANKEQVRETQYGNDDDLTNRLYVGHPLASHFGYTYDRLWQNNNDDLRMIALYKAIGGYTYLPGQGMVKDQPLITGTPGQEGYVSKEITWKDVNGETHKETVTYKDNGFGKIDTNDQSVIGSLRPKWVGGMNNTFTYKNWTLNFYIYARIGAMYNSLLQTYYPSQNNSNSSFVSLRKMSASDLWSENNPGGKYFQVRNGGTSYTQYNDRFAYQKASFVAIRNISLAYQLPQTLINKWGMSNAQVYAQVVNPFIFGGDLVKAGINPDDDGRGLGANSQSNNTALYQSVVIGVRFGF